MGGKEIILKCFKILSREWIAYQSLLKYMIFVFFFSVVYRWVYYGAKFTLVSPLSYSWCYEVFKPSKVFEIKEKKQVVLDMGPYKSHGHDG